MKISRTWMLVALATTAAGGCGGDDGSGPDAATDPDAQGGRDGGDVEGVDLVVVEAERELDEIDEGTHVAVTATVQNQGDADGGEDIALRVDGEVRNTRFVSVEAPEPGGAPEETEVEVSLAFYGEEVGEYELAVGEAEAGAVSVVAPDDQIQVASAEVENTSIVAGEETTVNAVVQNQGSEEGRKTLELTVGVTFEASRNVTVQAPASGEDPEDTEVVEEFAFSRQESGDYPLAVSGTSAGTVNVADFQGIELVSAEQVVAPDAFAELEVACPDGKVVFSGGAELGGDSEGEEDLRLQQSAPAEIDGASGWRVGIANDAATETTVTITAVCGISPPDYEIVEASEQLSSGGFTRLSPECPSHAAPWGGGFSVGGVDAGIEPEVSIQETSPDPDGSGWRVGVTNEFSGDRTVRAHAVCGAPTGGYDHRTVAWADLDAGGFHAFASECLQGQVVIGGGAEIESSGDPETLLHTDRPSRAVPQAIDSHWRSALSNTGDGAVQGTQHVICGVDDASSATRSAAPPP